MANVKAKARRILTRFPKREKGTGFIYRDKLPPARKLIKTITVYSITVSNEGGTFVRGHTFGFSNTEGRTRAAWKIWLADNYMTIMRDTILDSYATKYGGFWRLHTLLGWTADVNKRFRDTPAHTAGNKTKRKGKRKVKSNLRRR